MKQFLLLAGISAIGLSALADTLTPKVYEDALIREISSNGAYAVSESPYGVVRIFDLVNGKDYTYEGDYMFGFGKCISDNGIAVGGTYEETFYWKDGEWIPLPLPDNAISTNSANAITPDGSRICGNIGLADMGSAYEADVLMQAPCIWNATDDGFAAPVLLPYPEFDVAGRIPQYVKCLDISADGKIIIGEITDATGMLTPYPILYREDENGEWSYVIPHENLLVPEGLQFLPYPGDGPQSVSYEEYMTLEEQVAFSDALEAYYAAGDYEAPEPDPADYMTADAKAEYEKAMAEYKTAHDEWEEKLLAWANTIEECNKFAPRYETNSLRISADGKTYGSTVNFEDDSDPEAWFPKVISNVWVFDVDSDVITKYDQNDGFIMTYLANNGVAFARVQNGAETNSYLLGYGNSTPMSTFLKNQYAPYASWIDENMVFEFEAYEENEESGEYEEVIKKVVMTGNAVATPDLGTIALSVDNLWDYSTAGNAYVFDMSEASAVNAVRPVDGEQVIYDLSGRKLKNATAPGIYIINGVKKVVR